MCEYCKNKVNKSIAYIQTEKANVEVVIINGHLYVSLNSHGYGTKIDFCPMCGRKLTKEEWHIIIKTLCESNAYENFDKLNKNTVDEYNNFIRNISNLKENYSIAVDISGPDVSDDYNAITVYQIVNDKVIIKDTYLFK